MTICDECGKMLNEHVSIEISVTVATGKAYRFSYCPAHGEKLLGHMKSMKNGIKNQLGWATDDEEGS